MNDVAASLTGYILCKLQLYFFANITELTGKARDYIEGSVRTRIPSARGVGLTVRDGIRCGSFSQKIESANPAQIS